jgi:hypothetical protein
MTTLSPWTRSERIDYGPPDRARLILTLLGEDGKEHPLVLEARALRQLAQLLSDIQARFPGAFGH